MSGWVKVMNSIHSHPKILTAGEKAAWLYVCGLCYANEHLTDGYIPANALLVVSSTTTQPKRRARELVAAGLWEEVSGGWLIHDYLEVQTSARKVRSRRRKDADRKAAERGVSTQSPNGHKRDVHADSTGTVREESA